MSEEKKLKFEFQRGKHSELQLLTGPSIWFVSESFNTKIPYEIAVGRYEGKMTYGLVSEYFNDLIGQNGIALGLCNTLSNLKEDARLKVLMKYVVNEESTIWDYLEKTLHDPILNAVAEARIGQKGLSDGIIIDFYKRIQFKPSATKKSGDLTIDGAIMTMELIGSGTLKAYSANKTTKIKNPSYYDIDLDYKIQGE